MPDVLRRWRIGVLLLLVLASACAKRVAAPVVTAPRHPDYIAPLVPPDAPPALRAGIERGWQYLQGGDLRSAEREFGAAQKGSPQSSSADSAFGYLALARGRAEDALPAFDRALAREPQFVSALVGRGYALVDLRREAEAVAAFEAAVKADPTLTDLQARVDVLRFRATQDLLARAKTATDAGRLDDARVAYEQAITTSPDSAFLYRDLATVERKAGLPDRAVDHLRKAIDLEPGDARALATLGELLEERGDVVTALSTYEAARGADPSAVPASTITRLRDRVAALKLPSQYRDIPGAPRVTRADVAALVGVRLEPLVARAAERQVVITDIRGNWAQQWITSVVRAGIMDTLPNYEFDPQTVVRRGDLARTVSRLLALVGGVKPGASKKWDDARVAVADVPAGHLSYPAVSVAVASGVMPLDNGTFRLLDPVTGAEAVDIIGRIEALAR
jgi:tetratricopeptide (TPR) repeat protein